MLAWLLAGFACISMLLTSGDSLAQSGFVVGVPPIHSPRVLAMRYEPLRAYLEARLGVPTRVETAADFTRYHARTLRGDFDLTITPAHFARMAQLDAGFQPLTHFMPDHDALLVLDAARPLQHMNELRGRNLAVIDKLAITVMATLAYLEGHGLEAGRDFRLVEHRTHASVAHAVATGLAAAGVTTTQGLLQMPPEHRQRMVVHKHIADIPAFVMLARPGMDRTDVDRLRDWLLAFQADAAGRVFLTQIGYGEIRPATGAVMRRSDPYVAATRKAMRP